MTKAEQLAAFVVRSRFEDMSEQARLAMKSRVLDAIGCAIGAMGSEIAASLRTHVEQFAENGRASLFGGGGSAPDRAAFFNSALIRYLDFNDSYLARGETCHPSDNLGAVVAACEYANRSGRDLLTALAVSYQVQCRLCDAAPVRARGFDHTTQGAYAVAAGVAKGLDLDQIRTANALAMCGSSFNALRVTRTGALSNWKGLAYANTAFSCIHACLLAQHGITGPLEVFEGNKGFMETISGPFEIDWTREDLERVTETILKKFNAEIHSQSAIEGVLEIKSEYGLTGREVERIDIEIFDVGFHIIGGGDEGDKRIVQNKEQADHSLPYLVAVALLDGSVMPAQFLPVRIHAADVQELLQRVHVKPSDEFSRSFPQELRCRLNLRLKDGRAISREKRDYEGFRTRPASWESVMRKFRRLTERHLTSGAQNAIADAVANLDSISVRDLTALLRQVTRAPFDRDEGVLLYGPESQRAFPFLRTNHRPAKPRRTGVTEIRGPYYSPMGKRYLEDILETMGAYVDSLKFAGGSFSLMPRSAVKELIEICHRYDVLVSTGGFLESVLAQGGEAVDRYLRECSDLGFDIVEISCGFITIPMKDWLRLVGKVKNAGLKPKPEVGIQFGAGGATAAGELEAEGTRDPAWAIDQMKRLLDAGAEMIMVESEGITENVKTWKSDVAARFVTAIGPDKLMFEAADPAVFSWYIKNYGPEVNLFVDHSQIVQLECLRSGIWGTKSTWGRILTHHE